MLGRSLTLKRLPERDPVALEVQHAKEMPAHRCGDRGLAVKIREIIPWGADRNNLHGSFVHGTEGTLARVAEDALKGIAERE